MTRDFGGPAGSALAWRAALLAGVLAGCTQPTIMSERIDRPQADDKGEKGGLVYALPMTVLTVERTEDEKKNPVYRITPSIMPDQTARFRLRYAANAAVDDKLQVDVDSNLLLTTATADVKDRSGDILIAAAKGIASVARGLGTLTARARAPAASQCSTKPFTAVLTLDELRQGRELPDCSRISVVGPPAAKQSPSVAGPRPECDFSLCFRTTMTMIARIDASTPSEKSIQEFSFVAVDPAHTEGIDLRGSPLVDRVNTLAFRSGLLVSAKVDKPSSALAIANLPLEIIKAVLSAPAELLTLRYKNEGDILKGQAAVLGEKKNVVDAQQKLQQAVADATKNNGGAVTGNRVTGAGLRT